MKSVLMKVIILYLLFLILKCRGQCTEVGQDPGGDCSRCLKGYDISTKCATCVESRLDPSTGCTQCLQGEPKCVTGKFTFSVLFHSYVNTQHLCGECNPDVGPVCCDRLSPTDNCVESLCTLRLLFFVLPYGSPQLDVQLTPQERIEQDSIPQFENGTIFNSPKRSNPYREVLAMWTERIQFYIVTYVMYFNRLRVADRLLIDVTLGPVPNTRSRQTYYGIYKISQFDLTFKIECTDNNYYGPQCNRFCSVVEGLYTCDEMGNIVCTNESCDPETNCQQCTPPITTSTSSPSTSSSSTSSSTSSSDTSSSSTSFSSTNSSSPLENVSLLPVIGGVIGGVVVILIIFTITLFIFCFSGRITIKREIPLDENVEYEEVTQQNVKMDENISYGQVIRREEIELNKNSAYGKVAQASEDAVPSDYIYDYIN